MSGQQTEEVKPNIKVEHENQDSLSTQQHDVTINIPSLEDSVPATLANWDAILETVKAGRSIAGATGYSATPHLGKNEKTIAESQMTPQEHQMWTGFNDGRVNLPALDWATNRLSPPTSKGSVKVIPRRVEALNRLYKTNQADAGHIAWIMEKELLLLPLIKAMARVIGAEKDLAGSKECQEGQLAEIQSINRILYYSAQSHGNERGRNLPMQQIGRTA
ncbi:hypothetical protein F5884DRAFT_802701 [Xylogone sp. PMI_703]|nr:hypothetical protein F5884DRAFT_802701 [Xylogone sp. PMI_703]